MLRKENRLRKSNEIRDVCRYGRKIDSALFRIFFRPNPLGLPRFCFIVSRAVSKRAVVRNTLRRRSSEWIRTQFLREHNPAIDGAVVFSKAAATAPGKELYEELVRTTEFLRRTR